MVVLTTGIALADEVSLSQSSAPMAPTRGSSPWGVDDQRGAVNRITPEKVLEAAKLIKTGQTYAIGRVYEAGMPILGDRSFALTVTAPAAPQGQNAIVGHEEFIVGQLCQVGTQFDGLGHVGIDNVFYNGYDRREFVKPTGLAKLGVENVGVILTRGVLLDIAALKGRERLALGYEITKGDLVAAMRKQNVAIRPGDVVLIHTGWGSLWMVDNDLYNQGQPGIGVEAAHFLVEKQVVVVGSDNWGIEVAPGPDPELVFPVHQILITQNGMYNLENLDTSALANDKVYEFAFFFAPLKIRGATGSPANPVAVR